MKQPAIKQLAAILLAAFAPGLAWAFSSGSTGADGPLTPTVNTTVTLPASGILNYTNVNIPVGVTVKFTRNTANTPITLLSQGDVTIAGVLDLNGGDAADVGAAGTGVQGDDGQPGIGGPGGFDGGRGGKSTTVTTVTTVFPNSRGGAGLGPGGGGGGDQSVYANCYPQYGVPAGSWAGSGAGYGVVGSFGEYGGIATTCSGGLGNLTATRGIAYGSPLLLPLLGGSGGGGASGGINSEGAGGGGGAGAVVIAASGTINVVGTIRANGGRGGNALGDGSGSAGGGGSGGAIRLMATTLAGNGTIQALAGIGGSAYAGPSSFAGPGGAGAVGRIRIEADTITRSAATTPGASSDIPSTIFVAGLPTLLIASVAGQAAPANPTGNADVTLPATTVNPVTVVFNTTGVPVGNTVLLTVVPATGVRVTAQTPALTGTTASATASVQITLPTGPSVLQAQTTYTVVASLGDLLRNFAGNERVERVTLTAQVGGKSKTTLITTSGKEFEANADALAILARQPLLVAGS